MRKWSAVIILFMLAQGCAMAPVPQGTKDVPVTTIESGVLPEASLGMRREDIVKLLEREVTVGYEKDSTTGEFRPQKAGALFSTEVIEVNGIDYQVDSYIIADLKVATPQAKDILPLIYQKGILVGKGKAELEALKARGSR